MKDRYTVSSPDYTIGVDAYEKIREVCPRYGKTVVAIGGKCGLEGAQEKMMRAAEGVGMEFTGFILAGGETTYENIERVARDHAVREADMIFAVGGGKAIDTAKVVAHRLHKPYFTFPTVAGSCAASASIATIYNSDGTFREYAYSDVPPVHVFLCSRIMAQAPVDFLLRGIGDTLAKYYEAQIASRDRALEHRDGLGVAISRMCAAPVYLYGEQAVKANKEHQVSREFEEVVLAVTMTSGLVSNLAAPEFNGHMAHRLFTELAELPSGEQCRQHAGLMAYGIQLLLLCDGQRQEFEKFHAFCKKIGLPATRMELGVSEKDIQRVFRATEKKQDVKMLPYKITQDMLKKAEEELHDYAANKN